MYGETLVSELERIHGKRIAPEEGAILINYSVYFPYPNKNMVSMDVALLENFDIPLDGMFSSKNIIQNCRYPNKNYITLTKINSSKRCKFGTFFVDTIENLNKMNYIAFQLHLDGIASYLGIFPIQINLTREEPFASISCTGGNIVSESNYNHFNLVTVEPKEKGIWIPYYYYTAKENYDKAMDEQKSNCILIKKKDGFYFSDKVTNSICIYETPIQLYASSKELLGVH